MRRLLFSAMLLCAEGDRRAYAWVQVSEADADPVHQGRHIALALPFVFGLTVTTVAAAAESTTQCSAMLDDAERGRDSLDRLEQSLVEIDAERIELLDAIALLDTRIAAARAKGSDAMALRGERDGLLREVELIDALRPDIVAQLEALRASVDESERGYIACVESTIAQR